MSERMLFFTGPRQAGSRQVLSAWRRRAFDWSILNMGVKVAALMTEPILMRSLPRPLDADRWSSLAAAAPISRA